MILGTCCEKASGEDERRCRVLLDHRHRNLTPTVARNDRPGSKIDSGMIHGKWNSFGATCATSMGIELMQI